MNQNSGPNWVVSTAEIGLGILYLAGLLIAIWALTPAIVIGMVIGSKIWDVKFMRFCGGAILTVLYAYLLIVILKHDYLALAVVVVLGVWLLFDYWTVRRNVKELWVVKTTRKTTSWLFTK